jgi:glycosyltransferase involved in cell wall biosynthesis
MRILFLNNYYYLRGGAERVLFGEMSMLREAGHEVSVFSRADRNNQSSNFARYFPAEMLTENARVSLKAIPMMKELIYSKTSREGLKRVLDEFKPDVAHAHNIYGRLSTSVLDMLKFRRIPTVLTLHDMKLLCPSYLMLNHGRVCERCKGNRFYHAVISKCHKDSYAASSMYMLETWFNHTFKKYDMVKKFIAPSLFLRAKAIEFGWAAEKIVYIPNFIDKRFITASTAVDGYSLYLGRLSREKGVRMLLAALKALPVRTNLIITGDGPDREALQKMAIENCLPVFFTGFLEGKSLEKILFGAKVIIMPSESYENAPISLLEAFAWGKPVIGARIGGIPEMIDDEKNGYLFEPGNVNDLRDKWATLLNLPAGKAYSMGRSARQKVEQTYSAESHFERLMDVYQRAIGSIQA